MLFEVRTFEPPMREMGTLIVECANLVSRALPLLQAIGSNVSLLTTITEELTKLGRVVGGHASTKPPDLSANRVGAIGFDCFAGDSLGHDPG